MDIVKLEKIEDKIIIIWNEQVLLDSDVAEIYGVKTKRINEAVKNNPYRFPDGYLLEMTEEESENLKSKFSTSSWGAKGILQKSLLNVDYRPSWRVGKQYKLHWQLSKLMQKSAISPETCRLCPHQKQSPNKKT